MYRSQRYLQAFTLVLLLSLCFIQQVSSIKCYVCNSDRDRDCISNAAQPKFSVDCSTGYPGRSSSNPTFTFQDNRGIQSVEYDCGFAKGLSTKDGRTVVERGCAVRPITCDTYRIIYAVGDLIKRDGLQFERCRRCNSDWCNSSEL